MTGAAGQREVIVTPGDGEIYSLASFGGDREAKEKFVAELRAKHTFRHCDDCDFFTHEDDLVSCPECKGSLA